MPKKSDRPQHESAMSNLLPEVSLDEEEDPEPSSEISEENESGNNSSTELQNSSSIEEQNSSGSTQSTKQESPEESPSEKEVFETDLSVFPDQRPDLAKKLGPYVSEEVDEALEEVYLLLRRRFGGKASKSLIVEAALRYSLSDCLRREEDSEMASWMETVLEEMKG